MSCGRSSKKNRPSRTTSTESHSSSPSPATDGKEFLDDYREMRAFCDLRPVFYSAVQPLLGNDDAEVRAGAVVAAIPLVEHPALVQHREELADRARDLLSTSTDRYKRDRVFDALQTWGHDTSGLENADDLSARELRARRIADASWAGGFAEEPPF